MEKNFRPVYDTMERLSKSCNQTLFFKRSNATHKELWTGVRVDYTNCNLKKYFDIEVTHAEERRADTKSAFMGDVCRTPLGLTRWRLF